LKVDQVVVTLPLADFETKIQKKVPAGRWKLRSPGAELLALVDLPLWLENWRALVLENLFNALNQ